MNHVIMLRSSNGFYGAERVIIGLAKTLPNHGWSTELWVLESGDESHLTFVEEARREGINTLVVPCRGRIDFSAVRWINRKIAAALPKQVHLHTHDFKSDMYGRLATRGRDRIVVSTVHGWTSDTARVRVYEMVDRIVLRGLDAVICVSEQIAQTFGTKIRNLELIPNGVDTERFSDTIPGFGVSHWGIPRHRYVFGIFARLTLEKGHSMLLDAFRGVCESNNQAHLLITGDGPERENILQKMKLLGLEGNVTLVAAHMHVNNAIHDIDCYVSSSLTEGMPMVILEAMSSNIPVIATRVGKIPEMLSDGCGSLVNATDAASITTAMLEALADPNMMQEMATLAKRRVRREYGVERQAQRHAQLYERTIAERRQ